MKAVFVKEKDFPKFAKGKEVKNYRNEYVKDVNGERVNLIPTGEKIVVKKLTSEEKDWFCGVRTEEDVVMMSVTVGGWFPTELVCGTIWGFVGGGIVREMYSMNTNLSRETGWLEGTGMTGSRADVFLLSKKGSAIEKLRAAGFVVVDEA